MSNYNPKNWYWGPDANGEYFSSASQSLVQSSDSSFVAWKAAGKSPTPWPKDETGNATDAALQDVLTPYNLYVDLVAYAAAARYAKETSGITFNTMHVDTDRASQAMINGAFTSAKDDSTFTTKFKGASGTFVSLDNPTILALGRAVRDHVNACFSKEADVVAGINATPPTISSKADVDAAFATITV